MVPQIEEGDVVGREVSHIYDPSCRGVVREVVSTGQRGVSMVRVDFTRPRVQVGHLCLLDELTPLEKGAGGVAV